VRNRERIVAAARQMLVEQGPQVPFDEIARRAGIGNATLYRHFADRRALIHDVLMSVVSRTLELAETALAGDGDPFAALCDFAHAAVDERIGAVCGLFVASGAEDDPELRAHCDLVDRAVEAVMSRARLAGRLRTDVSSTDLMIAVAQLSRPLPGTDCAGVDVHRHLGLLLDGLRPQAPAAHGTHGGVTP